mgnify:CR=1 FL=1
MKKQVQEKEDFIHGDGIRTLLIEDNPGDARLMQELLREAGGTVFRLVHRDCLDAGMAYLTAGEVDVVLLDLGLPDSQGLETFLLFHARHPHLPTIVLTGLNDNNLAVAAVKQGAQDYLVKGQVNSDLLARAIRYAIERAQANRFLKIREQRYRALFENMLNGFAYCEMIYDDGGQSVDFRYLEVNDAFKRITGLENVEGKLITEIIPGIRETNPEVFEIYGRVARTGRPAQIELHVKSIGLWLSVAVYSTETGFFTAVFEDISERKRIEEERQAIIERLRRSLGATVQAIATVVEARDPYTAGHQHRTADLGRAIATEMGFDADRIDFVRIVSTIHDLGKISVPSEILSKPTKLTELEYKLIRTHAQSGHDILKDVDFPWPVAQVILQHHERMNGSGYPNGLRGDEILMESRIIAVSDVVESMASHRPYRAALGVEAALEEIMTHRGILYDAEVVDACVRLFREKGYRLDKTLPFWNKN